MASIGAGMKAWAGQFGTRPARKSGPSGRQLKQVGGTTVLVELGPAGEIERNLDPDVLLIAQAGFEGPELARAVARGRNAVLAVFYAALATGQAETVLSYAALRATLLYEPGNETELDIREATVWGTPTATALLDLTLIPQAKAGKKVAQIIEPVLDPSNAHREELVYFLAEKAALADRLTGGPEAERALAVPVKEAADGLRLPGLAYPVTMLLAILANGHDEIGTRRLMHLAQARPGVLEPVHTLLLALAGNSRIVIPRKVPRSLSGQPAEIVTLVEKDRQAVALLGERRIEDAFAMLDDFRAATERSQAFACWILANTIAISLKAALPDARA